MTLRSPNAIHKTPRYWSNDELRKFAGEFRGAVVNVSAWEDKDKQGRHYRDYFSSADEYWVTNYKADMRGESGLENELFLDLQAPTPRDLVERFDVVFNHTTLEHVFDFNSAMDTLVELSRDIVIIVVPFLQQVHVVPGGVADHNHEYSDYWRKR